MKLGYLTSLIIGSLLLLADFWFDNKLPVPQFLPSKNNIQIALAAIFLALVFRVIFVSVIMKLRFGRLNAKQFFNSTYRFIHEGNPDRLPIIAEELCSSIKDIIACAGKSRINTDSRYEIPINAIREIANGLILLIGDRRFCKVVVEKVPAFSFICFQEAQSNLDKDLPIFQFARSIGQEFIRNTDSSFYQEDGGYDSGLFGYTRPTTNIIFGHYEFVEKCTSDGASPLETTYSEIGAFTPTQMGGFSRASLAFFESYVKATKGLSHSFTIARMFDSFENALSDVYSLKDSEQYYKESTYNRLTNTVDFANKVMGKLDEYAQFPKNLRSRSTVGAADENIFDRLANLAHEIIFAASAVTTPPDLAWDIQRNAVWSEIIGYGSGRSRRIVAFKIRRLLYDDIMANSTNFRGARVLGFCLHVLGLKLISRLDYLRDYYPLQAVVLKWTKANYRRLVRDHPKVAAACLHGNVTYDSDNHQLVATLPSRTGSDLYRICLKLD